jgi:rhodanese-related sulfurtransferase
VGQRGYLATRILRQAGFDAVNVSGGYKTYRQLHPETNGR